MAWLRRLWLLTAAVGVVAAVGVLLGVAYGTADVDVSSVDAVGGTVTNATVVECPEQIVHTVDATVALSRGSLGVHNPQWWAVGVTVRASALGATKSRLVQLGPGENRSVTVPFTRVVAGPRTPRERVDAVVQVSVGTRELVRTTPTATIDPVSPAGTCP